VDRESTQRRRARVLVFPCGSEIGLELHRALSYSTHVELIGASSVVSNHGPYVFKNYVEGVPFVDDPGFIPALAKLARDERIDFIYPAHDSVVLALAQHADALPCPYIGSPVETCEICRSKRATLECFEKDLAVPALFGASDDAIPFPVFLKPDVGQGSRGVHRADSRAEMDFYLQRDPSLLILEFLPGPEYTIDCFTDRHGQLRFVGARERVRISGGISVDTRPVPTEEFQPIAECINARLALRGAWFFQMKRRADGVPTLLEIAPRVSGCMGLYRNAGINFPLLSIFDRMGQEVGILEHGRRVEMDRALVSRYRVDVQYRHVYLDLDDTLLFDGAINPNVFVFLLQCRRRGVRIHVLSRHAGDMTETLRMHGLTAFVDDAVRVADGVCKSAHITERDAIFIDDSFAERKRVHEAAGIPTFAVDAVESLIDWRC
jgi:hypothetical protein